MNTKWTTEMLEQIEKDSEMIRLKMRPLPQAELQGRTAKERDDAVDAAGLGCLGMFVSCAVGALIWVVIWLGVRWMT